MSDLLKKMASFAEAAKSITGELKSIHVDEWGADLFYNTRQTYKAEDKYLPLIIANKTEGFAELICLVAKDENGSDIPDSFARKAVEGLSNTRIREIGLAIYTVINEADQLEPKKPSSDTQDSTE